MCPLPIDCLPRSFRPVSDVSERRPSSQESQKHGRTRQKVVDCFSGWTGSLMNSIDLRRRCLLCSSAGMIA